MDPLITSGLIQGGAAGLETAGGIFATAANINQARLNRRFQASMSNTAHQREVKDLLAAGMNPLLTTESRGASTPTGATANIENPARGITHSASQYVQNRELIKTQIAQRGLLEAQAQDAMAGANLKNASAATEVKRAENLSQNTKFQTEEETRVWLHNQLQGSEVNWMNQNSGKSLQVQRQEIENAILELKKAVAGEEKDIAEWENKYGQKMKAWAPYVQAMIQVIGGASLMKHILKGKDKNDQIDKQGDWKYPEGRR